jgi:cytoskeletal protein CcmA (bactofilin family)
MTDTVQAKDIRKIEPDTIYVGEGASVKGDILAPNMLVVDGCIEGSVTGHAIWVGPSGEIKGKIVVDEAEIFGKISEKIEVKQLLYVHAAGRVVGEITYGELQLEKGAILSGTLAHNDLQPDKEKPTPEPVLGKSERPAIMRVIESGSLPNGNGAGLNVHLPASDIRGF